MEFISKNGTTFSVSFTVQSQFTLLELEELPKKLNQFRRSFWTKIEHSEEVEKNFKGKRKSNSKFKKCFNNLLENFKHYFILQSISFYILRVIEAFCFVFCSHIIHAVYVVHNIKRSYRHLLYVFIETCQRHHIPKRLYKFSSTTINFESIYTFFSTQVAMQIKLNFCITLSFHFIYLNTKKGYENTPQINIILKSEQHCSSRVYVYSRDCEFPKILKNAWVIWGKNKT